MWNHWHPPSTSWKIWSRKCNIFTCCNFQPTISRQSKSCTYNPQDFPLLAVFQQIKHLKDNSSRQNHLVIVGFLGWPYYISSPAPFNGRNRLLTDSLVLRFTSIVIFRTAHMMACSVVACHLTALLRHPCAQLFYHDLHAALSRPPFVAKNSKPQFLFHFPFSVAFPI